MEISEILSHLRHTKNVNAEYAWIDSQARNGGIDSLTELFNALPSQAEIPQWAKACLSERIVEALSLKPGIAEALAALKLCQTIPRVNNASLAATASRLATAQTDVVIEQLLREIENSDLETIALVLGESVLRGKISSKQSIAVQFHNRLRENNHPLAWLPAHRVEVEQSIDLPHYSLGCTGWGLPLEPMERKTQNGNQSLKVDAVAVEEISSAHERERIGSIVKDWIENSNGKIEVKIFKLAGENDLTSNLLRSLPLESLTDANQVQIQTDQKLAGAFRTLFNVASGGGAYSSGNGGAYGRLLAWHSVAEMVGVDPLANFETVVNAAERCNWILFNADSPWFYQVAWDFGVACLRENGNVISVIAATDTD